MTDNDYSMSASNCMLFRAIWDKQPKLVFKNMMMLPEWSEGAYLEILK